MLARTTSLPLLTLGVALLAILLDAVGLASRLQLDRSLVWPNVWQLVTCQLTHWSADHLLWDLVVFVILGTICEWRSRKQFVLTLAFASLLIPLAVLVFCPQITHFRGLSGIDSAIFGLLIARLFASARRDGDRLSATLAIAGGALFLAKCLYEVSARQTLFVSAADTFAVVPVAHLVGFLIGIACAAVGSMVPTRSQAGFGSCPHSEHFAGLARVS